MRVRVKIENQQAMSKFIKNQIFGNVQKKVVRNVINDIKAIVPDVIWEAFRETEIISGLSSAAPANPDFDIKAHLGLSDGDAAVIVAEIERVVRESIKVQKARDTAVGVDIQVDQIESNLRSSPFASYWSLGKEDHLIPWLEWILDGNGSAESSIIFVDSDLHSRSGRAIMKETLSQPDWEISDYWFGGNNFITKALSSPEINGKIRPALNASLNKHMKEIL